MIIMVYENAILIYTFINLYTHVSLCIKRYEFIL